MFEQQQAVEITHAYEILQWFTEAALGRLSIRKHAREQWHNTILGDFIIFLVLQS